LGSHSFLIKHKQQNERDSNQRNIKEN